MRCITNEKNLVVEITDYLNFNNQNLILSKVLGIAWDTNCDMFSFKTQNVENFISNRVDTKHFLLQTVGRIFNLIGFKSPYTIRIKHLIQEMFGI